MEALSPTTWASLVPAMGATTAVVVVVAYFLRHIAEQSHLNRQAAAEVVARFEAMERAHRESSVLNADKFRGVAEEFRAETRMCVESLIKLNRETVAALNEVTARVDSVLPLAQRAQHGKKGQEPPAGPASR